MLVVVSILNGYYFADLDGYYHLSHWLSTANFLNIVLLTLIFIVLLTKRFALQVAGTVMFAIFQIYGMLMIWALRFRSWVNPLEGSDG